MLKCAILQEDEEFCIPTRDDVERVSNGKILYGMSRKIKLTTPFGDSLPKVKEAFNEVKSRFNSSLSYDLDDFEFVVFDDAAQESLLRLGCTNNVMTTFVLDQSSIEDILTTVPIYCRVRGKCYHYSRAYDDLDFFQQHSIGDKDFQEKSRRRLRPIGYPSFAVTAEERVSS